MKNLRFITIPLMLMSQQLFAQSDDPATKGAAMAIAALVFFGILALVRGIKARNKHKDE